MEHFAHAGGFQLIGEYVDIETGKGCDVLARRPHLAQGLGCGPTARCPVIWAMLTRGEDYHGLATASAA